MNLLHLATTPEGFGNYACNTFTEEDVERLKASGADLAAYWYACGNYSGAGNILARKDGRWYHHDCGHCSCYGPTDFIDFTGNGGESLDALLASCTTELRSYLEPLAELLLPHLGG